MDKKLVEEKIKQGRQVAKTVSTLLRQDDPEMEITSNIIKVNVGEETIANLREITRPKGEDEVFFMAKKDEEVSYKHILKGWTLEEIADLVYGFCSAAIESGFRVTVKAMGE